LKKELYGNRKKPAGTKRALYRVDEIKVYISVYNFGNYLSGQLSGLSVSGLKSSYTPECLHELLTGLSNFNAYISFPF